MKSIALITSFAAFAVVLAVPPLPVSLEDNNPIAFPFARAVLPISPGPISGYDIFKRQGCPNLSLRCPSGSCCSYDTSCCGNTCCPSGYLCTGGTPSAPCCVAIGAQSNACGGSVQNACSRPGDLPCNGINICCPPANACYYDSSNVARCSPLAASPTPSQISKITTSPTPYSSPYYSTSTYSSKPASTTSPTPYSYPYDRTSTYSSRTTSTTSLPYPGYSSPPIPNTSYSDSNNSFWTTGAIAGVAVGSFVGLVLFVLLIWLCCRKRYTPGPHSRVPQYATPLSDAQISALIKFLDTPQAWQHAYIEEAKRMRTAPHTDPASWMIDFTNRAVAIRIQQMRGGDDAQYAKTTAGLFGLVPFGKLVDSFFKWSTKRFNRVMFETVGLGDIAAVENLYKQAEDAASSTWRQQLLSGAQWLGQEGVKEWWKHAESAELLQQELSEFMVHEFGFDLATALLQEGVHIKWGIGQAYSVGRAVGNVNQKMIKALDWLYPKALEYHLRVFAANALTEVFPNGANKGYADKN